MKRSTVLCAFASLCILLSAALPLRAEWALDGVPVVESSIETWEFPPLNFGLKSDGQGGALIVWTDRLGGSENDIFIQRIDSRGDILWAPGGIPACAASGNQTSPRVISDGSGGWIVFWTDRRGVDSDVYAQRFDAAGDPLWAADGAAIHAAEGDQKIISVIPSGASGAIVLWMNRMDEDGYSFDARLIDMNAAGIWTAENITGNIQNSCERIPLMISDGAGGAIVAWKDPEEGHDCLVPWDIRVQRLDSAGELHWGSAGRLIVEDISFYSPLLIQPDGSGGAILGWVVEEEGVQTLFAQRILSSGLPHWLDGGVSVCSVQGRLIYPILIADGSGGVIVSWTTRPTPLNDPTSYDIFAQRIDRFGDLLWAADGVPVCAAPTEQQCVTAIPDGVGGAIFAWTDFPKMYQYVADIRAQHITGEGTILWPSDGLPVCTAAGQQAYTQRIPDGAGGAVIAWVDSRNGIQAGYVQRIDRHGNWGYPAPAIAAVRDVPGDQGGAVSLAWSASRLDPWPLHAIAEYSIWRAISHEDAALVLTNGGAAFSSHADFARDIARPLLRVEQTGNRTYYWMRISTVTASHLDGYSEIVPTLFDITAASDEYHYFQVIAHGDDPDMYWISRPDSGRSSDDLAPAPPACLAGTAEHDGGLRLTWNRCTEADLDHYTVYRGPDAGFEPSPDNLLSLAADTVYTDGEWRASGGYWYKVAAVDVHGNESACSLLGPEDIESGSERKIPSAPFLAQNFPNPFNPITTVSFGLKEQGHASLRIYDTKGRLVRVLMEKDMDAGIHEVRWDGRNDRGAPVSSGVYFCSLKAGSFAARRKLVLLR